MWDYLKTVKKPMLLYGMGDGAEKILIHLKERQIPVAGVFASDGFVRGHSFHDMKVLSYSDARQQYGDMCVLLSFGTHRPEVVELVKQVMEEQELYAPDVPVVGEGLFDRAYYEANQAELMSILDRMEDEKSKSAFKQVMEYRISGDIRKLFMAESVPMEAWDSILQLNQSEIYLDLGAYTGDTIREFLFHTGGCYEKIYGVEPDPKTFKKLQKNTQELECCVLYPCAIHSEYARQTFASLGGRNSVLSEKGSIIESDSVDHLLAGQRVTYVKMDVEGQELEAIRGAERTIRACHPKMMISCYHRVEDFITIPKAVWAIDPTYKLYFRHYPCLPMWDSAFYFI